MLPSVLRFILAFLPEDKSTREEEHEGTGCEVETVARVEVGSVFGEVTPADGESVS